MYTFRLTQSSWPLDIIIYYIYFHWSLAFICLLCIEKKNKTETGWQFLASRTNWELVEWHWKRTRGIWIKPVTVECIKTGNTLLSDRLEGQFSLLICKLLILDLGTPSYLSYNWICIGINHKDLFFNSD